jgi:BlaI family penicillinase repressor
MNKLPAISEAEYEVMKIVWKYAPISTNEVVERLLRISNWTPQTIQTLLSRLAKKGALNYSKNSRVFIYTPLVKEEQYLEQEKNMFLEKYYGGKLNSMLMNFLDTDKLSKNDIMELKTLLDERLGKRKE